MQPYRYAVWEWVDEDGIPVYVGYGEVLKGTHPAARLFAFRDEEASELGQWLQTLAKEPRRSGKLTTAFLHLKDAKAIVTARRRALTEDSFRLLSDLVRTGGSRGGGGAYRSVVSPEGDVYRSVRAAARELGMNQSAVTRWCADPQSGWAYVN